MKNNKKRQKIAKIVLKNGNCYVIIRLPKFVNKQTYKHYYKQKNIFLCEKNCKEYKRNRVKMVNIKDAANYVIGLFYNNNLNCTSAVVQKVLVIAQMKYMRKYGEPLFEEAIIVKPACFSVDFVSKFYPINIFENAPTLLDESLPTNVLPDRNVDVDIDSKPKLSSYTYKIERPLSEQEKNVLGITFSCFHKYTGAAIGEAMQKMELHKRYHAVPGTIIDVKEQCEYIKNIELCESNTDNSIINFILTN